MRLVNNDEAVALWAKVACEMRDFLQHSVMRSHSCKCGQGIVDTRRERVVLPLNKLVY